MSLRIDQLRRVVKTTLVQSAAEQTLRHELVEAFGPALDARVPIVELAERANDELTVLERRDLDPRRPVKLSVLLKFAQHPEAEVRRMVTRLLPERFVNRMLSDKDPEVRATAAKRVPLNELRAASRVHSRDTVLSEALANRSPHSAGVGRGGPPVRRKPLDESRSLRQLLINEDLSTDVEPTMDHDDAERLGDAVKQAGAAAAPDLSEAFYENLAHKFVQDYDVRVIESNWRPTVVSRFASSVRATSGVKIDEEKLRKAIDDVIAEREEASEGRSKLRDSLRDALKETKDALNRAAFEGAAAMPIIEEVNDPASDLLECSGATEFMERFSTVYSIRESQVPAAIRKFRVGESAHVSSMPAKGQTPGARNLTESDERALDRFVESWNKRQALIGEPIRISWYPAPHSIGAIGFEAILR